MKTKLTILFFWLAAGMLQATNVNGTFQIAGSQILGPDGNVFIPRAVNVSGMKWGWPGNPVSHAAKIVDDWGFNMIRVNCRIYDYYWDGKNVSANSPFQTIIDMQPIVDAFTSKKVVVMFEFHDATGSYYEGERLYDLMDAWRDIVGLYGDNPYVWYNIMNEPGGNDSPQQIEKWVSMHQQVIKIIRDEQANNNIIVVDGHFWGQDAGTRTSDPVEESNSSILSAGDRLLSFEGKTYENIMFSFHAYDQWNVGNPAQLSYRMHDFIERIKAKGYAVMIGEYGTKPDEGHLYFPNAFQTSMDVAPAHGVGLAWWHWYGGDNIKLTTSGNGGGSHIDDSANPTNLTWAGRQVWDHNHFSGNRKPFVTLYSPTSLQSFSEGDDISVKAAAADLEDSIKEVRMYIDGQLHDIKSDAPFHFVVPSVEAGRYLVTALAQDNQGNETFTANLAVVVNPKPAKGSVLFVTGSETLSGSDHQVYNQILKEGYFVYHKHQGEVTSLHANNRAAIVLSGTVTDVAVGSLFAGRAIPLIAGNSELFSALSLTGSVKDLDYGTVFESVAEISGFSSSSVVQGFAGEVDIYTQQSSVSFGIPGAEADVLATVNGDAEKAVLFIYSAGSNMYGQVAPAGRGAWFGKPDPETFFTENSLLLFGRMLNYIISGLTSIDKVAYSEEFLLEQNYPNPFVNSTTIEYSIKKAGHVRLEVINFNGTVEEVLVNQFQLPGNYSLKYTSRENESNGVLFYRIRMNKKIITRTMIALKAAT